MQIIVFPEACITGYWFLRHQSREQLLELAEPVFEGASSRMLIERAERYRMVIGAGADGWVHAVDLRTRGRGLVRNALARAWFAAMGFDTLCTSETMHDPFLPRALLAEHARQRDPHLRVTQEAIAAAKQGHGALGPNAEGLLQACDDPLLAAQARRAE